MTRGNISRSNGSSGNVVDFLLILGTYAEFITPTSEDNVDAETSWFPEAILEFLLKLTGSYYRGVVDDGNSGLGCCRTWVVLLRRRRGVSMSRFGPYCV